MVWGGPSNQPPSSWQPFKWTEPSLGLQEKGQVATLRPRGTSGSLSAGFWRVSASSPGAAPDGSIGITYSAPLGDETACVIEGSATLTVLSTGVSYEIGPGSIVSSPKGLAVHWAFYAPFFKKWWCIWDSAVDTDDTAPNGHHGTDGKGAREELRIGHVSDNPEDWEEYHFAEPREGPQVAGELYYLTRGSSRAAGGTMMSGIWRSGKGIAGTNVDGQGTLVTPYTGVLGDETILLLEGEVEVVETESGTKQVFRAGDLIGLSAGMHATWRSKGPFSKKLWVITRAS